MSQKNRISIEPSPAIVKQVIEHIVTAHDLLKPYLQGLSAEERLVLPKMSDKTVAFVDKTNNYANSHNDFAPRFLNVPELGKDVTAVKTLKPILDVLATLHSDVDDTVLLCGSEAYAASRIYYNSVVYAAKQGTASAKPIMDDLSKRFPGTPRKKADKADEGK